MKYLLDTHFLLWMLIDPNQISTNVQTILLDKNNQIFYSPISLWEINIKYSLNKLDLKGITPEEFYQEIEKSFALYLPLDNQIISTNYHLPRYHKDPFDRLLIWQSICENLIFISEDGNNPLYVPNGLKFIN